MIKRILWILLLACFLTGCGPQSAVPTVGAQETPVPTTEPTAQQFESESLTELLDGFVVLLCLGSGKSFLDEGFVGLCRCSQR